MMATNLLITMMITKQTNDDEDDENSANKDDTGDVDKNKELCTG